jgi:hypothetical protein
MGKEMARFLVGPMPARQFLNDFFLISKLPNLNAVPPFKHHCYSHTIAVKTTEILAYEPFISQTS